MSCRKEFLHFWVPDMTYRGHDYVTYGNINLINYKFFNNRYIEYEANGIGKEYSL